MQTKQEQSSSLYAVKRILGGMWGVVLASNHACVQYRSLSRKFALEWQAENEPSNTK